MLQKVTDDLKLVVRKYYLVRCAKMVNESDDKFYYLPIIGIEHADTCFSNNRKHYHIDGRFTNKQMEERAGIYIKHGKTNHICNSDASTDKNTYRVGEIEYRRLQCKRLITGIDPPPEKPHTWRHPEKYLAWVEQMKGKSCKGKKCPHLGTTMQEVDGELVCPLHNLKGSISKEIITGYKRYDILYN